MLPDIDPKLFSGERNDKQEDGFYFIDTDASIFEHIFRYLRTGVLFIFYDTRVGHDFLLYQSFTWGFKVFRHW